MGNPALLGIFGALRLRDEVKVDFDVALTRDG